MFLQDSPSPAPLISIECAEYVSVSPRGNHVGHATGPDCRPQDNLRPPSDVVSKDVPAQVCPNCGEYYLDADVSKKLMAGASTAFELGTEIEIVR